MATPNTSNTSKDGSKPRVTMPLIIVGVIVVIVGLGLLIFHGAQKPDPTLTAAPPTGSPANIVRASPEKMAKERQIRAQMDGMIAAIQASRNHAGNGHPGAIVPVSNK